MFFVLAKKKINIGILITPRVCITDITAAMAGWPLRLYPSKTNM